jgi:integrase
MALVEAAKNQNEVAMIHTLLNKYGGELYADIWAFGINTAMRIGDLLEIKLSDVIEKRGVLQFSFSENKTGKARTIELNKQAAMIFNKRKQAYPAHTFLFEVESNRAKGKAISRQAVTKRFKEVGDIVGIKLGTHSMRKTRGRVLHTNNVPIEKIMLVLNHSSPAVTMLYLGITNNEVQATYHDFEIECDDIKPQPEHHKNFKLQQEQDGILLN